MVTYKSEKYFAEAGIGSGLRRAFCGPFSTAAYPCVKRHKIVRGDLTGDHIRKQVRPLFHTTWTPHPRVGYIFFRRQQRPLENLFREPECSRLFWRVWPPKPLSFCFSHYVPSRQKSTSRCPHQTEICQRTWREGRSGHNGQTRFVVERCPVCRCRTACFFLRLKTALAPAPYMLPTTGCYGKIRRFRFPPQAMSR